MTAATTEPIQEFSRGAMDPAYTNPTRSHHPKPNQNNLSISIPKDRPQTRPQTFSLRAVFGSSRNRRTARVTLTSCPMLSRAAIQRFVTPVRLRTSAATISFSSFLRPLPARSAAWSGTPNSASAAATSSCASASSCALAAPPPTLLLFLAPPADLIAAKTFSPNVASPRDQPRRNCASASSDKRQASTSFPPRDSARVFPAAGENGCPSAPRHAPASQTFHAPSPANRSTRSGPCPPQTHSCRHLLAPSHGKPHPPPHIAMVLPCKGSTRP